VAADQSTGEKGTWMPVARTLSGRDLDAPYAHVFSLSDGKVTRNDIFNDTALWLAALG
jgi:ketosteroid isomerase-like protein